jgi:hypothetical protein
VGYINYWNLTSVSGKVSSFRNVRSCLNPVELKDNWYFNFSWQWVWRWLSCELLHHVVWWKFTEILGVLAASIIKIVIVLMMMLRIQKISLKSWSRGQLSWLKVFVILVIPPTLWKKNWVLCSICVSRTLHIVLDPSEDDNKLSVPYLWGKVPGQANAYCTHAPNTHWSWITIWVWDLQVPLINAPRCHWPFLWGTQWGWEAAVSLLSEDSSICQQWKENVCQCQLLPKPHSGG